MEEVQKNENGTTAPQADGKPKKEDKPKRELTPQQVQQRRKMIVFPLMFLAFAGCMYLIFDPSGKEDVNVESVGGFNADIPLPAEDGIIADKQKAYEQAMLNRKQQDKIQSLQDFGFTGDDAPEEPQAEIELMPEKDTQPRRGGGASSSANAYRDINRQLGSFYEEPKVDGEKEELKRQVEELTAKLEERERQAGGIDDQVALMEKSYELAAKYMGGQNGTQTAKPSSVQKAGKSKAEPVRQVERQMVSSLAQPAGNAEVAATCPQERNRGFNTAVGGTAISDKNTLSACVYGAQSVTDGQAVRLRLLEPMAIADKIIPRNAVVVGTAKIQGERLEIGISSLEHDGTIIPIELAVYDTDGQPGIFIPNSLELNAVKEVAANMGSSLGSSINISTNAGAQLASDLGKGLIQGTSQYISKKMRTVKVHLKSGYRVMLYQETN